MMVKKKESEEIKEFLKGLVFNKKFQWAVVLVLFLAVLISSTSIRLSNVETLKSSVTGEYLSNDLDSMYFYRQAETQIELGHLPMVDEMRAPGYEIGWIGEILPDLLVWNFRIIKLFNSEVTFNYATTISSPYWFAIGLVLFFILSCLLTRSKTASLVASAFLAYAPAFLFRSIAGFYDHDLIGVLTIFLFLIGGYLALKYLYENWRKSILAGILMGFLTALVFVSWRGAVTFILLFFPVALFIDYLMNNRRKICFVLLCLGWISFSVIFTKFLGLEAHEMYSRFLDAQGILSMFVFGFALVDYILSKFKSKIKFVNEKYEPLYSLGITIFLGLGGLMVLGRNPISLFKQAWATLIYPFFGEFGGRLAATVAENAQPYLVDLINQNTALSFWFFVLGLVFISINFTSNSKKIMNRLILSSSIGFIYFAILFSRYSSGSLFNGENFISQGLYLIGGLGFLIGFVYVYSKEKFKISIETLLLFSMALTVALNARAAVRSFFLITPFICLIGAYGIIELVKRTRSVKEESFKPIMWILVIIIVLMAYVSLFGIPFGSNPGKYQIVSQQAQYVGPSANIQWQNAMEWARTETPEKSIFVHWWDYGYFVQTMGKRPSVTDGGHAAEYGGNINIGRYILTTSEPETALSFMKTWNVSYLLIDPTEMGKYGAFSKIGSNDSWDRVSAGIFGGASDDSQMQETATGITKVYQLGGCVDSDISYNKTFLPGITISKTQQMQCNSYVGGVVLEVVENNGQVSIKQPTAVFFYNNRQYRIPIKNVYAGGQMMSFAEGIDSVVYLIPRIDQTSGQIDNFGAMIYLSPRTHNSLMGRLYILNDYYNEYPTLKEARFEDDPVVAYFKQFTGGEMNEFVWYGGLRAPLKIWEVTYPAGTPVHEEFISKGLALQGGLDYLFE